MTTTQWVGMWLGIFTLIVTVIAYWPRKKKSSLDPHLREAIRDNINGLILESINAPEDSPFLDMMYRNAIEGCIEAYRSLG